MRTNRPSSSKPRENLLSPDPFDLKEWREGFILTILRLAVVFGVILIVITFPTSTLRDRVLYIAIYLLLLGITILPAPYLLRAYALLAMILAIGVNAVLAWGPWKDGNIFLLGGIVLSAILLDRRADIYVLGGSILTLAAIATLQLSGAYTFAAANVPATRLEDWVGYIADFTLTGAILAAGISQFKAVLLRLVINLRARINEAASDKDLMEQKLRTHAEELETRMTQIRASSNTARDIARSETIVELLENAVTLMAERFGYYHVGLFVLDEQKRLSFLQAASSKAGKDLIGQTSRIEPDKRNPIYMAVEFNRFTVSTDLDRTHFLRDANFPLTRSRMILPLSVRNRVFGFFDIHSDQPRAFTSHDAEILQSIADLTAIAFENTRLANETQNLLSQLELNASTQTQRTWVKMASRQRPAYLYTPAGVRPVFHADKRQDEQWEDGLRVPLTLHGRSIGNIKLKRKGIAANWNEREKNLIQKIADQIALALENSRLVDEAQKNAARDQMIANISTRIRETLDIEAVISTAASEMRRIFDLKEAEIVVGAPQQGVIVDDDSSPARTT